MTRIGNFICATVLLGALGCGSSTSGGQLLEMYNLAMDYIRIPDACYVDSKPPTQQTTTDNQTSKSWQVWDGPDSKAYLDVGGGGINQAMGSAPTVSFGGVLEGTRGQATWSFSATKIIVNKPPAATYTETTTTKATVSFDRASTIKGTMRVESLRVCEGGCVNDYTRLNPPCTIDNIAFRGTRVAVTYLSTP